jgi:hypothetical protein
MQDSNMSALPSLVRLRILAIALGVGLAACGVASADGGAGGGHAGGGGGGPAGGGSSGGHAGGFGGSHGGGGFHGDRVRGNGGWHDHDYDHDHDHDHGHDHDHDHDHFGHRGYGWGYDPFLSTLPFYYSTFWWDGVPYYYAHDNYYVWNGSAGGYQAVDPPPQVLNQSTASAGVTELYAYPKNGQSAEQQARDKQECETWAAQQATLHAPQPASSVPDAPVDPDAAVAGVASTPAARSDSPTDRYATEALTPEKREQYLRAESACLEGRGYSVN